MARGEQCVAGATGYFLRKAGRTRDDFQTPDPIQPEFLSLVVERILWQSPSGDNCIANVYDLHQGRELTLHSPVLLHPEESITVTGGYRYSPKGWSFHAQSVLPAEDAAARERLDLWLEKHPGVELTELQALALLTRYGEGAGEALWENPYRALAPATGFPDADLIAEAIGVEVNDPRRLEAGVRHAFISAELEGHCFLDHASLVEDGGFELARPVEGDGDEGAGGGQSDSDTDVSSGAVGLGERSDENNDSASGRGNAVDPVLLTEAIERLIATGDLVSRTPSPRSPRPQRLSSVLARRPAATTNTPTRFIFSAESDQIEGAVAANIHKRLANRSLLRANIKTPAGIQGRPDEPTLSAEQLQAVKLAASSSLSIITGGPGSGKTTTIRALGEAISAEGETIILAAPTGKAARRITEATGHHAATIHRLLYSKDNSLSSAGALIVDEASMIDLPLAQRLLENVGPDTRIIFVGDPGQLPPVGRGSFFADMIRSECVPVAPLQHTYRQSEDSLLLENAIRINRGEEPFWSLAEAQLKTGRSFRDDFRFIECSESESAERVLSLATPDTLLLSPQRRGLSGVHELNRKFQDRHNPNGEIALRTEAGSLRVGDPALITKNDRQLGVVNGERGRVASVDRQRQLLRIDLEDRAIEIAIPQASAMIEPGYVLTVHKAQGSQAQEVLCTVADGVGERLLSRNLVYTAITRAQRQVTLVGSKDALRQALENDATRRNSLLSERLRTLRQSSR